MSNLRKEGDKHLKFGLNGIALTQLTFFQCLFSEWKLHLVVHTEGYSLRNLEGGINC